MSSLSSLRVVAVLTLLHTSGCALVTTAGETSSRGVARHASRLMRFEAAAREALLSAGEPPSGIGPKEKSCLNFLHIPKTAGTSIELAMKAAQQRHPNDPRYRGWGFLDHTLNCSHPHIWVEDALMRICQFGANGRCYVWHIPPSFDETLTERYAPCDTFCVVRHPVDRFVSEWHYKHDKKDNGTQACSMDLFREFVDDMLLPHRHDCHFLPQTEYVGDCQHVLHYETLDEEFPRLMAMYGLDDVRLPEKHTFQSKQCENFNPDNLADDVLEKIRRAYASDFEYFGYE